MRAVRELAGFTLTLALLACGDGAGTSDSTRPATAATPATAHGEERRDPASAAAEAQSEREAELGPFLAAHWRLPVPAQGPPPDGFSVPEASLDPAVCGACHPKQYAEWRTSLHATAWSPGLAGQLIEGDLAHPLEVRSCQTCHTPLEEQMPFDAALQESAVFDPDLRQQGVLCAGCHVRAHRRFGPPARPDAPRVPDPEPHAGFEVRTEFQESRFCAECHQFFDDDGLNGKPIENTYAEWQASPQAREGRQCQDCHMPDRAHTWRGIHDRKMVREAIDVELIETAGSDRDGDFAATLVLRNRDVGHAFPTYVTPRVFLEMHQVNARGAEIEGTRVEGVIARVLDLASGVESSDTRVLPGESVRLDYPYPVAPGAQALVGRVRVDPDHHYRLAYATLLDLLQDETARALIRDAAAGVAESEYVLEELRLTLRPASSEAGSGD